MQEKKVNNQQKSVVQVKLPIQNKNSNQKPVQKVQQTQNKPVQVQKVVQQQQRPVQNNNQKPQLKPQNNQQQRPQQKPVQNNNQAKQQPKPQQKPVQQQRPQNNNQQKPNNQQRPQQNQNNQKQSQNQQKPVQQQNKPQPKPQNNAPVQSSGKKWVYFFGEGDVKNKELLGGKGANLGDMTKIGLPVPAGFTITTEACAFYDKNGKKWPNDLMQQIESNIKTLESKMGMKFGDSKNPLLVSVRSGAKVSMPGMMDTILNLGLNDQTVQGLVNSTKNERFALDCYRRFIQMFGDVVMNVEHKLFEEALEKKRQTRGLKFDNELTPADLKQLIQEYKQIVQKAKGKQFPNDVREQLRMAVNAVFESWNSDRAIKYREINEIKSLAGTAVNIQSMVFGNMGNDSGTGVAFTRNPSTGENKFYGEYLINAQGEDVVAGIRTPEPIARLDKDMPAVYKQLVQIRQKLEQHYKDMQDIEFTVQKGKLYMLQTRNGKRTGLASVRTAVEMVKEGLITQDEALLRVDANQLNQLLHKRIDPLAKQKIQAVAHGLPASPGAAVGKIVFNAEDAACWTKDKGEKVILVRQETSPEDIEGMHVSQGILTARGGMTSHAAVVARGMGKCCVAGCPDIQIDEHKKTLKIGNKILKEGDFMTLDGTTGEVYVGQLAVIDPELAGEFGTLMDWAKKTKKLGVRTNADTPKDAEIAKKFGAEGIGLTRTEHMFFEGDRILAMREMILADSEADRRKALNKLLPYQRKDFEGIFSVMNKLPVIIRFLDPPLHEFLPKEDAEIKQLSQVTKIPVEKIKERIDSLHEFNPMLGFRGCRLGVVYPEISEMQARAIFEAAIAVGKKGIIAMPEIEVPNIIALNEFRLIKDIIKKVAKETGAEGKIHYQIGTMIEFPRAAMVADELAKEAEFMSFGTNDLTQTTLGFSRDDAGKFIPCYVAKNIFEKDPFQTIDQEGVGKIMKMTVTKARGVKPNMDMGICGEHGGDPASVKFCHKIGLSNVSCSPYRVPIAILAAAQAVIEERIANVNKNLNNQKPIQQQNKSVQQNNTRPQQQNKPIQQQNKPVQKPIQNNQQKQAQQQKQNNNQQRPQQKPQQNQQQKPQQKPVQQAKPLNNNQQRPQQNNQNKQQLKVVQNKPQPLKQLPQKSKSLPVARTIRDEIRDLVREELSRVRK